MRASRKFILFELNEVPLRVFRHYAERHPESAVARLLARGRCWDTVCEDEGHLSPWISWPTLHRGVSNHAHGIAMLGQELGPADTHYPPVWQLLARAGRSVGMFGSLHSYPLPGDLAGYSFYLPDTFAAGPEAHPAELSAFQRFNLCMVDKSSRNVSTALDMGNAARFVAAARRLGLRRGTVAKIARQLVSERFKPDRSVRRRTIQSVLSFDLFRHQLADKRPDAAFYFTNHVASAMHRYWSATFGEDYRQVEWRPEWVGRFAGEIDYAMREADAMLADLIAFADADPDYIVLIGGSMGQAAVDEPLPPVLSQVMLLDPGSFMASLGIHEGWRRRRAMAPCYTFGFDEARSAECFLAAVAKLRIAGEAVEAIRADDHGVTIILGHPNVPDENLTVMLGNHTLSAAAFGVGNMAIQDEVGSAAYHVPQGCLHAYDPRQDLGGHAGPDAIATTRVAPTLLAMLDVPRPLYMDGPIAELAALASAA